MKIGTAVPNRSYDGANDSVTHALWLFGNDCSLEKKFSNISATCFIGFTKMLRRRDTGISNVKFPIQKERYRHFKC